MDTLPPEARLACPACGGTVFSLPKDDTEMRHVDCMRCGKRSTHGELTEHRLAQKVAQKTLPPDA